MFHFLIWLFIDTFTPIWRAFVVNKFLTKIFLIRTRLITEVISDRGRCFDARYTSRLLIRSFFSFPALSSFDSSSCRGLLKKTLKNERDDDCDYERTRTTARRDRQTDGRTTAAAAADDDDEQEQKISVALKMPFLLRSFFIPTLVSRIEQRASTI